MLIIGDIHGRVGSYRRLLQKYNPESSLQVGDFGFRREHDWFLRTIDTTKHKINFGNHDYYPYLEKPHSCGNWSIEGEVMTMRGAWSIDRRFRVENIDWWAREEMSKELWEECIVAYTTIRPPVVVSHDCPHIVRDRLFSITDHSITSDGLQRCFEIHQPELWVFGHHHLSSNTRIDGTQFICLAELEVFSL